MAPKAHQCCAGEANPGSGQSCISSRWPSCFRAEGMTQPRAKTMVTMVQTLQSASSKVQSHQKNGTAPTHDTVLGISWHSHPRPMRLGMRFLIEIHLTSEVFSKRPLPILALALDGYTDRDSACLQNHITNHLVVSSVGVVSHCRDSSLQTLSSGACPSPRVGRLLSVGNVGVLLA